MNLVRARVVERETLRALRATNANDWRREFKRSTDSDGIAPVRRPLISRTSVPRSGRFQRGACLGSNGNDIEFAHRLIREGIPCRRFGWVETYGWGVRS